MYVCIHSFIPNISIAPLQVHYCSDSLPTTITVSELSRRSATDNCEWRTCPRSRCGGWNGIRTCNPRDATHLTYHWVITPHVHVYMYVWMYACMHVCMYVRMYVGYVCMYACMHVCMNVRVCTYVCRLCIYVFSLL